MLPSVFYHTALHFIKPGEPFLLLVPKFQGTEKLLTGKILVWVLPQTEQPQSYSGAKLSEAQAAGTSQKLLQGPCFPQATPATSRHS